MYSYQISESERLVRIVATGEVDLEPGVQFGMGRMIATLAQIRHVRMNVFHDEAAAREWLRGNGS